jgi:hypothetical protein
MDVPVPQWMSLIVLVVVLRPRFLHRRQTEHDDDHEHDQEIPRLPLNRSRLRSSSSISHRQQIEHDDHEHDEDEHDRH